VLGAARGPHAARSGSSALGRARAVAGCDLSADKLDAAAPRAAALFYTTSYAELLARPEVEIVAIYTPDALHGEHVVAPRSRPAST
jgi:predicted dehydrogenase